MCQFLPSYRVHKIKLVDSILSRLNLVKILTPKIHFNIILPRIFQVISFLYVIKIYFCTSFLSRAILMFFPSVSPAGATRVLPTILF
jgi:hypothetical protein